MAKKKPKSKGKICAKGKAWAKRTFDVYPSAYANLAASKYCKSKTYGKKKTTAKKTTKKKASSKRTPKKAKVKKKTRKS